MEHKKLLDNNICNNNIFIFWYTAFSLRERKEKVSSFSAQSGENEYKQKYTIHGVIDVDRMVGLVKLMLIIVTTGS